MMRLFDKLNLRPQERRLVMFVAVVVFVALNWFFVRPYFGELGRTQQRMKDADAKIVRFNDEIRHEPDYQKQKDKLASQGGLVPTADQASSLIREINNHAGQSGMNVQSLTMAPSSHDSRNTNSFFEEQAANLSFANTGESELIRFLYSLASQNSLIRVKSMVLRPDPGQMKLGGTITLVESFQKKPPTKIAAATTAPKATNTPTKATPPPPKATNSPPKAPVLPKADSSKKSSAKP